MLKQTLIAVAIGALALSAQSAMAQQFNGGLPAAWTCVGSCGTSGADGVVILPPNPLSNQYGWVSTSQGVTGVSPFNPPASEAGNTNGSTLTSNAFHANAGDQLDFYFNYVTSDGGTFTDYGWSRLLNAGDSSLAAILFTARTEPSGSIIPGQDLPAPNATLAPSGVPIIDAGYSPLVGGGSDTGPNWTPLGSGGDGKCWDAGCGYTGWVLASYTIATAGAYRLEFGVTNWDDQAWDSGMAFDGVTIAGVQVDDDTRREPEYDDDNYAPVPEPETYAMLLAGLGLLGFTARHRKQSV
ncbi:MAG: NF038132 family protein [Nitrosomonadales bacterium]|nr:NF038132 family protein [Nitrosomonadales bacterium]